MTIEIKDKIQINMKDFKVQHHDQPAIKAEIMRIQTNPGQKSWSIFILKSNDPGGVDR